VKVGYCAWPHRIRSALGPAEGYISSHTRWFLFLFSLRTVTTSNPHHFNLPITRNQNSIMNNKTIRSMVPIERPHITLDPYYDNPMSATRRYITSTDPIEGTRASLKRKRNVYCPSLFEKLPYELREQVYALLGLPIRGKVVQECREGSHCRNNSHFIMKDYGNLVTKVHLENMEVSATITSINWDRALHNSSPNTYGTIRGLDGLVCHYTLSEKLTWTRLIELVVQHPRT
jgi:hypothetical protein